VAHTPIEQTAVFQRFDEVSRRVWEIVVDWDGFAKRTCGEQLVRAVDSVGANLVEGDGRYSDADALRFFEYARASAREARYWLSKAVERKLVEAITGSELIEAVERGTQMLNALINYRRKTKNSGVVREEAALYGWDSPNAKRQTPNAPIGEISFVEEGS
jgi:four helix bundle protein